MKVELFGSSDARLERAIALRVAVFVVEQGVPLDEELDAHDTTADPTAIHAVVCQGERPVGTGRLYFVEPGVARIGRMAVAVEARGRGVGRAILEALMREARERGFRRAVLAAQTHAQTFYNKAGFAVVGDEFVEAGIAHVEMARQL
ncbi:MAG TPA: GNAT family N-acetyltransferase [Verrucomicrobiae bacterium]|jgi:predicted GNAT family N-acyltransferase|nr:GNAT family N-acetyltransferase [Verrucomicrobiae bacterium]